MSGMAITTPKFSEREQQVADGLIRRRTLEEIGAELGISPFTVKHYAETLRLKLGVKRRKEIAAAYEKATSASN